MIQNLLSFTGVLQTIGYIFVAVLILLATITVHEFGHYIVGKIFKFKINEFAIGMGPAIYKKTKKNGEIFSIRILPLGGFCAFEGEDEDIPAEAPTKQETSEEETASENASENAVEKTDENAGEKTDENASEKQVKYCADAFNNKKPWQRILVLIAGASVNFICAILIVVLNFSIFGHSTLAIAETIPTTDTYALQKGDVINAIDGHYIYLSVDMIDALNGKKKNDIVSVDIIRDGKRQSVEVMLRNDVETSSLTDYSQVFNALGVATVPMVTTDEDSPFKSGEYFLRFNDDKVYSNSTRIYDREGLFAYLASRKVDDVVEIWMSTSDENDDDGRVPVPIRITQELLNIDKTDMKAYYDYFGIKSMSYSYQLQNTSARMTFGELLYRPIVYGFKTVGVTFKSFGGLFNGSIPLESVSGPIGTISLTAEYARYGLNYLFEITALIGFSVAIFNLLPIPALDGARAVFVLIEWIRGKPINRKVEGIIHTVGLFVLLGIAIFFDVLKIF